MATYLAEADALATAYERTVGDCLELRIPVHVKGRMRCLGDLRDDIRAARAARTDLP